MKKLLFALLSTFALDPWDQIASNTWNRDPYIVGNNPQFEHNRLHNPLESVFDVRSVGSDHFEIFPKYAKNTISLIHRKATKIKATVRIYSPYGCLLKEIDNLNFTNSFNIDTDAFEIGLYIMSVQTNDVFEVLHFAKTSF